MIRSTFTKSTDSAVAHFLAEHAQADQLLASTELHGLKQLRAKGLEQFATNGFPTLHDENWKYTNITPITQRGFKWHSPAIENTILQTVPADLLLPLDVTGIRLVFVNGHFAPHLSVLSTIPENIQIANLANLTIQQSTLFAPYLGQLAVNESSAFTALNTAFIHDGVFIHISPNTSLTQPIHLLFLTTPQLEPSFNSIRNLIIVEDNSQATIIEDYANTEPNTSFTNTVTELFIGKHATVEHSKLLRENSQQTYHVGTLQVQQRHHSRLTSHSFTLGTALARSDTNVVLAEEHAECVLNGLYLTTGKQHIDHHTTIEHTQPHGSSRENYKGVLADSSRAVFNGKVIVHPGAYKTNAEQSNKNLLLSNNTEIDTKPQLEIYNDDVRCMHGATVGQLNENSIFYLRARGISEADAKRMLIYAFIREILELVPVVSLQKQLNKTINSRNFSFEKNSPRDLKNAV